MFLNVSKISSPEFSASGHGPTWVWIQCEAYYNGTVVINNSPGKYLSPAAIQQCSYWSVSYQHLWDSSRIKVEKKMSR